MKAAMLFLTAAAFQVIIFGVRQQRSSVIDPGQGGGRVAIRQDPGRKVRAVKFSKAILDGKTQRDAAIEAGYSPKSAESSGSQMAKSPDVQEILNRALDKAGATIDSSARVIAEAQRAKTVKHFAFMGKVKESKTHIDHPTRLHAAELNYRSRKLLAPKPQDDSGQSTVNLIALVAVIKQASEQRGLPT